MQDAWSLTLSSLRKSHDALLKPDVTVAVWTEAVNKLCRVLKHFETAPDKNETLQLILDCMIRLFDKSFDPLMGREAVIESCRYLFALSSSRLIQIPSSQQKILVILYSLKNHGYYFLAHEGTELLVEMDQVLEKELAYAIARYYREKHQYVLSQFYLAYGRISLDEMYKNERIFLAELFCDEKNFFVLVQFKHVFKDCVQYTTIFEKYVDLADYFCSVGDFERAKRICKRLEDLCKEYKEYVERLKASDDPQSEAISKVYDDHIAKWFVVRVHADDQVLMPLKSPSPRSILRDSTTEQRWPYDVKTEVLRPLCEETLKDLGPAPCKFSVIALGSLARDEACLYSDIEFGLVWKKSVGSFETDDEIKNYFRQFVLLFKLKIISFGETNELALFSTSFPESKASRVLIKKRMRRGLQLDEVGNYPFSELHENALFLQIPLGPSLDQDDVVRYNCVESCHLWGAVTLSEDFNAQVREVLDKNNLRQEVGLALFDKIGSTALVEGAQTLNIKVHLLKLPQWGIKAMAIYYGIEERNTLLRIDALVKKHILIPEMGEVLKELIVYALDLRNKLHRAHGSEHDELLLSEPKHKHVVYLIQHIYPKLKLFFESWCDNPEKSNLGLTFMNDIWISGLSREITIPDEKTGIVIYGLEEKERYLKRDLCDSWMEHETGELKQDSRNIRMAMGDIVFVLFDVPESVGQQYADSRFLELLIGKRQSLKPCVFENTKTKKRYPVLFSLDQGGKFGYELHEDHYRFTLYVFSLLLLYSNLDDFLEKNGLNNHFALKAFHFFNFRGDKFYISPEAVTWFLALEPGDFLRRWLDDLALCEKQFGADFAGFVEPGKIGNIYANFYRLRRVLRPEKDIPSIIVRFNPQDEKLSTAEYALANEFKQLNDFYEQCTRVLKLKIEEQKAGLTKLLPFLQGSNLHELSITDFIGLSDGVLLRILSKARGLQVLDVSGCDLVKDATLTDVADYCEELQRIDVSRTKISSVICRSDRFLRLQFFKMESCKYLKHVQLDMPHLLSLSFSGAAFVRKITLNADQLQFLNLSGCERLVNLDLGNNTLTDLKELNIEKCPVPETQIAQIRRESSGLVYVIRTKNSYLANISDRNPKVRKSAFAVLMELRTLDFSKIIQAYINNLSHWDIDVRQEAFVTLGELVGINSSEVIEAYISNLRNMNSEIRQEAALVLRELNKFNLPIVIQSYIKNISSCDSAIVKEAKEALAEIRCMNNNNRNNDVTTAKLIAKSDSPTHSPRSSPRLSGSESEHSQNEVITKRRDSGH